MSYEDIRAELILQILKLLQAILTMKQGSSKSFDTLKRKIKNAVTSDKLFTICITVKNDEIHLLGEKQLVEAIKKDERITMKDVFSKLSNMQSEKAANLEFTDIATESIPKLRVHFKSDAWNHVAARSHLRTYMNILGFRKNGEKNYGVSSDKPKEWPDSLSFETFKGPNYATISDANLILESIFQYNNLNIYEHVLPSASSSSTKQKRKKSIPAKKSSKKRRIEEEEDTEEEDESGNDLKMVVTKRMMMKQTIMMKMKRMIILKRGKLVMMRMRMTNMGANLTTMTKILNSANMRLSGRETLKKRTDFINN